MPVFKDMLKGRFWLSVAITLLVSAAVNALGALLISKGPGLPGLWVLLLAAAMP